MRKCDADDACASGGQVAGGDVAGAAGEALARRQRRRVTEACQRVGDNPVIADERRSIPIHQADGRGDVERLP